MARYPTRLLLLTISLAITICLGRVLIMKGLESFQLVRSARSDLCLPGIGSRDIVGRLPPANPSSTLNMSLSAEQHRALTGRAI